MWLNAAADRVVAATSIVGSDPERGRNLCEGLNKESKAQLGVAMYELGVSYLNSWGVAKDESMAMTCFELGAQLGDPDAMYELAALCCRNGLGHKKDLHKAAALYREAADKGVSTVGNCWIYKEKYLRPRNTCDDKGNCPDSAMAAKKKSLLSSRKKPSNN
ncbi:hypothetical protein V1508DRAFT_405253 [Lipomyces doorenjongii]|uniref:uncharacterized protein n=1 Tax=Lipomyces doorenjongii TaxID=383834 RepID=UPI0034CF2571